MSRDEARPRSDEVEKTIVGWREYVELPDWGVSRIKAKVDTGARTSAIDVAEIEELPDGRVSFVIVINRDDSDARRRVEADILRRTKVKSSFGAMHDRLIVSTRVRIGSLEKTVEMSLVSRRNMLCRMLLGRKALEPNIIVDPSRRYVHGRRPRRRREHPAKEDQ